MTKRSADDRYTGPPLCAHRARRTPPLAVAPAPVCVHGGGTTHVGRHRGFRQCPPGGAKSETPLAPADRRGTRPRRRALHPDEVAVPPTAAGVLPSANPRRRVIPRLARPCPPTTATPARGGMGRVTPWSPHEGARLGAGPGHARVGEREDPERRCTHHRATYLQRASGSPSRGPWMPATDTSLPKTKNPKRIGGMMPGVSDARCARRERSWRQRAAGATDNTSVSLA
jgi:hypothetical protein